MSRSRVLLMCVLSFGSAGTLQASPLDSPDIVYINGQPCNSLCRSYLALSRQMALRSMQLVPGVAAPPVMRFREDASELETYAGAARPATRRRPNRMPRTRSAALRPAVKAAVDSTTAPTSMAASLPEADAAAGSGAEAPAEVVTSGAPKPTRGYLEIAGIESSRILFLPRSLKARLDTP